MSHGIGRSGDIAAVQPKAAGSSLMVQLLNLMVLDALHIAGLKEIKHATTFPTATGMTLSIVLLGLRLHWKYPPERRVVLWSRIDQKSCFKAIVTAGFEMVVVPLKLVGDALETNLEAMADLLELHKGKVRRGVGRRWD
jgi:O-phospho-L-seryl-tRNASec:L-selenocysteinyl-tRNA synthase